MGLQKNVTGQKALVFAFDRTDNTPKTGDAANITGKVRKDYGSATAITDTNPTEIEDGYYEFDLTQAETNADVLDILPESSTSDIQVIGVPGRVFTIPENFPDANYGADGYVQSNVREIQGSSNAAGFLEDMLTGAGATLYLNKLKIDASDAAGAIDIDNDAGSGIVIDTRSSVGSLGIDIYSDGTAIRAESEGGGHGMVLKATAVNGSGLFLVGNGLGDALHLYPGASGHEIYFTDDSAPIEEVIRDQIISDSTAFNGADIASILTDTDALDGRLTSARAGYLDNLNIGENVAGISDITGLNDITAEDAANAVWDEDKSEHTGDLKTIADRINKTLSTMESDIRGADNDDLKDISDQIDGVSGSSLTKQDVRDSMALDTAESPVAGSVDQHLDDVLSNQSTINGKIDTIDTNVDDIEGIVDDAAFGNNALRTEIDTITSKLPSGTISDLSLSDTVDGITLETVFELVSAMVNGRYRINYPDTGKVTFYKRDNVTVLFTVVITTSERNRV